MTRKRALERPKTSQVPGADLEVLPALRAPTDVPPDVPPDAAPPADPAARRRWRWRPHLVAAALFLLVAAVTLVLRERADDPAADARELVAVWDRADAVGDAADRASVRVRVLVPAGDVDTTFRALRAVRDEERTRLRRLLTRVQAIDAGDDRVARGRDAVVRALSIRERRARLVAEFYGAGAEGVRDFTGIERAVVVTGRDARAALDAVRARFSVDEPPDVDDIGSPAMQRAIGRYGRVVDTPLGVDLLLVVGGRPVVLDLDADPVRPAEVLRSVRNLVTLGDGSVAALEEDLTVRMVARRAGRIAFGEPLGDGDLFPSARADAVWVVSDERARTIAREITTAGRVLEEARLPSGTDFFVVGATSAGFVMLQPREDEPPRFGLWSPGDDDDVRVLGSGWLVAAHGDTLVTSPCEPNPIECTLAVTDVRTGAMRTVEPPGGGAWRYEEGAISPDGAWLAVAATSTGVDGGLLFVDLDTLDTQLVRVAAQATDTPHGFVWDDRRRVFALDRRNGAMWARPGDAEPHPVRLQVAFDRPLRVDALAIVPR